MMHSICSIKKKGKCIYPKRNRPSKNKMSAKKKYNTIIFIHLIHKVCQILSAFTSQCHCLHLHCQCFYLPHIHSHSHILHWHSTTYLICPIHCFGYSALLTTLHSHFCWDMLPCRYDPHWPNNLFIFHGLWTYLNPWRRFTLFSTDDGIGIKDSKYMCSGVLCCVCGLISLNSGLLLWFLICGLVWESFLSVVVNFSVAFSLLLP